MLASGFCHTDEALLSAVMGCVFACLVYWLAARDGVGAGSGAACLVWSRAGRVLCFAKLSAAAGPAFMPFALVAAALLSRISEVRGVFSQSQVVECGFL